MKVLRCTDCTRRCITLYSTDIPRICMYDMYADPVFVELEISEQDILNWFDSKRLFEEWLKKTDV